MAITATAEQGRVADVWRDRLALLLESTGEGIFGIDLAGRCVFVNRSAAQQLGWPRRADARPQHARADPPHACRRPPLPGVRLPDLQRLPPRPALPHRRRGAVARRRQRLPGRVLQPPDRRGRRRCRARWSPSSTSPSASAPQTRCSAPTTSWSAAWPSARALAAARAGRHLETVREDERTRIAREIHDELGSLLVALKMDVQLARQARGRPRPRCGAKCQGMGRLIDTAVDNVGRIITDLRPSILDHQGLWAALEWQAQEFVDSAELDASCSCTSPPASPPPEGGAGHRGVPHLPGDAVATWRGTRRRSACAIRIAVDGPPRAGALPRRARRRRRRRAARRWTTRAATA